MKNILSILFLTFSQLLNAQTRTVHVFVALCDNKNQGIIPVPKSLGNGQYPATNLYWGATYGVKNFFTKKSPHWKLLKVMKNPANQILERIIFKHKTEDVFLLADGYDGAGIKSTMSDFFNACSGGDLMELKVGKENLPFGGNSNLLVYIGHDGLMEFDLNLSFYAKDTKKRQAIMLACISKHFFSPYLKQTNAEPLLWTTGLMAPEAYILEAALDAWIQKKTNGQIQEQAAAAYHQYQKCGINAAKRLFVSGW